MGDVKTPQPVLFFCSIIFRGEENLRKALALLTNVMGTAEAQTPATPFTQTTYYAKEMGVDLQRTFVLFRGPREREALPHMKLGAKDIEDLFASKGQRIVNIDPGYIALEHVILATTKGYAHRAYLGGGIHADLTLIYREGAYRPLEWTYPDYREQDIIALFHRWRDELRKVLRCRKA